MKTISKIIVITILLAGFSACNTGTGPEVEGEFIAPREYVAQANVISVDRTDISAGKIRVSFEGTGSSNLIGDEFKVELSHSQYEDYGRITIVDGRFIIRNDNGDMLSGSYTGYGAEEDGVLKISQNWSVESSEGRYLEIKGMMFALLTQRKGNTFDVYVTGNLP